MCLAVSNNLCRKLVSSLELPVIFDGNFRVTSVSFFVADFNLSSCESDIFTFTFTMSYFYTDIKSKQK